MNIIAFESNAEPIFKLTISHVNVRVPEMKIKNLYVDHVLKTKMRVKSRTRMQLFQCFLRKNVVRARKQLYRGCQD